MLSLVSGVYLGPGISYSSKMLSLVCRVWLGRRNLLYQGCRLWYGEFGWGPGISRTKDAVFCIESKVGALESPTSRMPSWV